MTLGSSDERRKRDKRIKVGFKNDIQKRIFNFTKNFNKTYGVTDGNSLHYAQRRRPTVKEEK